MKSCSPLLVTLIVTACVTYQTSALSIPPHSQPKTKFPTNSKNNLPSRRNFLLQPLAFTAAILTSTSANVNANAINTSEVKVGGKIVYGDETIMNQKGHGSTESPVQSNLLYGVDQDLANKICSYNRRFAEFAGSFTKTSFEKDLRASTGPMTFYDSVTGKPLFVAPVGRDVEQLIAESEYHGWPSFRDEEVVWENVRVLKGSGETVSVDGTHLGHNIPDKKGNRYCINLVSVAGNASV